LQLPAVDSSCFENALKDVVFATVFWSVFLCQGTKRADECEMFLPYRQRLFFNFAIAWIVALLSI
jgi:hypothetical protein